MHRRSSAGDLVDLDLEIEATCRRNNAERRRKILQEREVPILEEPCSSESSSIYMALYESLHEELRVSWLVKRKERLVQLKGERCHIPWYP